MLLVRRLRVALGTRLISWGWRITPRDLTERVDFTIKREDLHDFSTERWDGYRAE